MKGDLKTNQTNARGKINRERIFYDEPATGLRLLADFDYPLDDLLGICNVIKQKDQH